MANKTSVVALMEIQSAGLEKPMRVKTFDKAWEIALDLQRPVRLSLIDFVRKD